jgi:hypothetical protein
MNRCGVGFIGGYRHPTAKRDWGHARDYVEGMWRILISRHPSKSAPRACETAASSEPGAAVSSVRARAFAMAHWPEWALRVARLH